MVIGTNMSALNDALLLQQSSQQLQLSLQRLSSGTQITSPADDAAGLGETMRLGGEQLRNQAASNNLSDALSFEQTRDGYLANITTALDRMSELAVQSQDVTKSDSDRALYNLEYQTLGSYVDSVQNSDFNGVSLFSGQALNVTDDSSGDTFALSSISANYFGVHAQGYSGSTTLGAIQPGAGGIVWVGDSSEEIGQQVNGATTLQGLANVINTDESGGASATYDATTGVFSVTVAAGHKLDFSSSSDFSLDNPLPSFLGLSKVDNTAGSSAVTVSTTFTQMAGSGAGDISTISDAGAALSSIKSALNSVASDRANIGADIERIQNNVTQLGTLNNNLAAASSRIADVDVAQESTVYARENILVQTGTAMLAQANSQPMSVLKLLS